MSDVGEAPGPDKAELLEAGGGGEVGVVAGGQVAVGGAPEAPEELLHQLLAEHLAPPIFPSLFYEMSRDEACP